MDDAQERAFNAICTAFQMGIIVVILAGAGSGKTETGTRAIRKLGELYGFEHILVISHTNATVHTFRNRLKTNCDIVSTIHKLSKINCVTSEYTRNRQQVCEGTDFDMMLDDFVLLLSDPNSQLDDRLSKIKLVFIDEFQDTGDRQMQIVRLLRERLKCGLVVVGDLAQAIYRFQGGDIQHMISLQGEKGAVTVILPYNYRSDGRIVLHANRLGTCYRKIDGLVEMKPVRCRSEFSLNRHPLQLRYFSKAVDIVQAGISWIEQKRQEGILKSGDVLTLYQDCQGWRLDDYAGRSFEIFPRKCESMDLSALESGIEFTLRNIEGSADEIIDLSRHLHPPINACIRNRRPKLLISCFNRNGTRAAPFMEIKNTLIANQHECMHEIFFTSTENKELTIEEMEEALQKPICFLTVHGSKGGQWDSVLYIDLGENQRRPQFDGHPDQLENHNKLYTVHTRAIDEIWHYVAGWSYGGDNKPSSVSRFMTPEVASHFNIVPEDWETTQCKPVVHFQFTESDHVKNEVEFVSVTKVSKDTNKAHQSGVYTNTEILYQSPQLYKELPKKLRHKFNTLHGIILEWFLMWELHKNSTRLKLKILLENVNHRFYVNWEFAQSMNFAWENASLEERQLLFSKFEICREQKGKQNISEFRNTLLHLVTKYEDNDVYPRIKKPDLQKLSEGFGNINYQKDVVLCNDLTICPVRTIIRHFDNKGDTYTINANLKNKLISACKNLESEMGNAPLMNKFICILFMTCVQVDEIKRKITHPDEANWGTLLDLMTVKPEDIQVYLQFLKELLPSLSEDARKITSITNVADFQVFNQKDIQIESTDTSTTMYKMVGFADAASQDGILEITSRETNAKTKVQQAFIYAATLGKQYVYNFYVETRKLVSRELVCDTSRFLQDTFYEYILKNGLPNQRDALFLKEINEFYIRVLDSMHD